MLSADSGKGRPSPGCGSASHACTQPPVPPNATATQNTRAEAGNNCGLLNFKLLSCVKSPVGQVAPSLAASGALSGVLEVAGVLDPIVKTPGIQCRHFCRRPFCRHLLLWERYTFPQSTGNSQPPRQQRSYGSCFHTTVLAGLVILSPHCSASYCCVGVSGPHWEEEKSCFVLTIWLSLPGLCPANPSCWCGSGCCGSFPWELPGSA